MTDRKKDEKDAVVSKVVFSDPWLVTELANEIEADESRK
jgi:hypothetical protein